PDAAGARHLRARDPGERARPRSARGRDRPARGGADRTGKGVAARPGAPGREGDSPGDRRAAPARQLRRVGGWAKQRLGGRDTLLGTFTRPVPPRRLWTSWRTFGARPSHPRHKSRGSVSREGGGSKPHPRVGRRPRVGRMDTASPAFWPGREPGPRTYDNVLMRMRSDAKLV